MPRKGKALQVSDVENDDFEDDGHYEEKSYQDSEVKEEFTEAKSSPHEIQI